MDPVDYLLQYVPYREGAGNANRFSADLKRPPEAWCGDTVTDAYLRAGHRLPSMQAGVAQGFAGVFAGMNWAKANGLWIPSWEAQRNDALVYGGPSFPQGHTGLVISAGPRGATGYSVEGNRHDTLDRFTFVVGEDAVLGVIKLSHFLGSAPPPIPHPSPAPVHPPTKPTVHPHPNVLGAWPKGPDFFMVKSPLMRKYGTVRRAQQRLIARGWKKVPAGTPYSTHAGRVFLADDLYGDDTAAVMWAYQTEKHHPEGLTIDGKLGVETWTSVGRTDNVT